MIPRRPTSTRIALAVLSLIAAQATVRAQGYAPTKGTPQAFYPTSPQATAQGTYPTVQPYVPGSFEQPCFCPLPTGYCPFPTGYCPLPRNQCGLASPQGAGWGSPQGYAPAPTAAPCAPCAATRPASGFRLTRTAARATATGVK